MISQGRIIYALSKLFRIPDTLKIGYSFCTTIWCGKMNQIRSFFDRSTVVVTTDPNLLMKYVNDGPTTNGFPKESPGNIGRFIGWNTIRSYAENHPDISLSQLMEEKDLQKIFQESKYKPQKKFCSIKNIQRIMKTSEIDLQTPDEDKIPARLEWEF